MDLTDIWQEHKHFILSVTGALILLLVGKGVLGSTYPVGAVARDSAKANSNLRKEREVKSRQVRDVRSEVESLRERLGGLMNEMQFKPAVEFVDAAAAPNPRTEYFRVVGLLQEVLVDMAERQGILIPEKLGLPDRAPTDPVEIRRSLRALNVIRNVVISCINAGIKRIVEIRIEDKPRVTRGVTFVSDLKVEFEIQGSEASLRQVVDEVTSGSGDESTFLELTTPTSIEPVRGERDVLQLTLNVAALKIQPPEGVDLEDA